MKSKLVFAIVALLKFSAVTSCLIYYKFGVKLTDCCNKKFVNVSGITIEDTESKTALNVLIIHTDYGRGEYITDHFALWKGLEINFNGTTISRTPKLNLLEGLPQFVQTYEQREKNRRPFSYMNLMPSVTSLASLLAKQDFETVYPSFFPRDLNLETVDVLHMDSNVLKYIKNDSFLNFENLSKLSIVDCMVYSLNRRTFRGLNKLVELDLTDNVVTEIENGTFEVLLKLKRLILRHEIISTVSRWFYYDPNDAVTLDLEELYLEDNRITSIEKDVFLNTPNLKKLKLDNNFLRQPEAGIFPKSLKYLSLRENRLLTVGMGTFANYQFDYLGLDENDSFYTRDNYRLWFVESENSKSKYYHKFKINVTNLNIKNHTELFDIFPNLELEMNGNVYTKDNYHTPEELWKTYVELRRKFYMKESDFKPNPKDYGVSEEYNL